jgi:hydroxymethylbilane synthase
VPVKLIIATRRSALALWQAEHVRDLLQRVHAGLVVELLPVVTEGDRIQDRPLAEVGGKGLFIKELEVAMLEGRAHLAVHSMKDVPWNMPEGFTLAAFLPRADARDAFVSNRHATLQSLPEGARVGTSSQRRQCLLRALRPDLDIALLRGNVDTRLRKLDAGDYDAIVLAAAGLGRLGLGARITATLAAEQFVPAVGQGAIGIECRDDPAVQELLAPLNDPDTQTCLRAERAFAEALGAGCTSPIAAHATLNDGTLSLSAVIGSATTGELVQGSARGERESAAAIGRRLAGELLATGGLALLDAARRAH